VLRAEYGLTARDVAVSGQGALGEVWRVTIAGGDDLAVKLVKRQPPEASVALQVAHVNDIIAHGIRTAASIPDRQGRYACPALGGWLRVSVWLDGDPADPADPLTPARLGDVLGRLHAHARPMSRELDGNAQDGWYHRPPDPATLANLVGAAEGADPRWAGRLDALLPTLQTLCGITKAPTSLVCCHRDLHPDNVLVTPEGQFAVLDWDNLGPADPSQELASVVLHWFADHTTAQGAFIRSFLEAYRSAGGIGALTAIDDFAMHMATSLNFLVLQLQRAGDPRAVAEIEQMLSLLPTHEVLTGALSCSA
jgi:Ser/Thr protein kinase RdoA (MazF antagonist)